MKGRTKPKEQQDRASDRMKTLMEQAKVIYNKDQDLSHRYVHLARKIGMKYKVRWPRGLKRQFCKHCYHYLLPGKNCRIRTRQGKVVYYCLDCKKFMKYPIKRES